MPDTYEGEFYGKKMLSMAALWGIALSANAQSLEQVLTVTGEYNPHGILPSEVLIGGSGTEFWLGKAEATYNRTAVQLKSLTIYDEDFKPKVTLSSSSSIIPISYRDSYRDCYYVPVTQDLFNEDSAYEYIVATSNDEDGNTNGFSIKQEDGTILYSMSFGEKEWMQVMRNCEHDFFESPNIEVLHCGGRYYLCLNILRGESYDYACTKRIYSFEKGNICTSIKKVADIPTKMKVSPTLPAKNETIKVDLSSMSSPCKLTVVDMNGKVRFAQSVQVGQKSVELSTSGLAAGMYIIRVSDGKNEVDNCRVIIR